MSDKKKSPLAKLTIPEIVLFMRRRTYLTVAIVSWAIMLLLAFVLVIPQVNLIIAHNENLGLEQTKLTRLQQRSTFLTGLNATEISEQLKVMQTVLPSQKPVTPLISSIERLAAEAGASLQSYELAPGTIATEGGRVTERNLVKGIADGVGSLPLSLDVQGGFIQMNSFFKTLDQLVPMVNVKTIDFTVLTQSLSGSPDSLQYKATVELDSLYALPESGRGEAEPVLTAFTTQQRLLIASMSAIVSAQEQLPVFAASSPATGSGTVRDSVFSY